MITVLKWLLYFSIALALQMTYAPAMQIGSTVYPEALLIPLFILSIEEGRLAGIWSGFFVGLLADTLRSDYLGAQALAMTLVGGFVGLFCKKKFNSGPVVQFFIFVLAAIIHDVVYEYSIGQKIRMDINIQRALYTAILSAILLFVSHIIRMNRRR